MGKNDGMPGKKNAVRAGISGASDIKAPFLTRFAFKIVQACMIACAVVGLVLTAVGGYYMSAISDGGLGVTLVAVGVAVLLTSVLGFLGCWKRVMTVMVFVELVLVLLFITLYVAFVIAFMMAVGAKNPVDTSVDAAWANGFRRDIFEKDADRWCKKNTNPLGPCKLFYRESSEAVKKSQQNMDNSCNMTVTQMALNCLDAETNCGVHGCLYVHSKEETHVCKEYATVSPCAKCDQECNLELKKLVESYLDPAVTVNFLLVFAVLVNLALINFLLGQPLRLQWHVKLGYLLNGCVFLISFLAVLFLGVVLSKVEAECPKGMDCTSWTIMASFIIVACLSGVAATAIVGLFSERDLFLRIANLAYVGFALVLLLVAVIMGMASGAISDVNAYYDENWPDIRSELNANKFCDDVDCKANKGVWNKVENTCNLNPIPRPKYMDASTDVCRPKMEEETKAEAVSIVSAAFVVIICMMAAIYFNMRGIKQLNSLGDYQDAVMGEVTEARAAMMMQQAKVLAERNALENKIASEKAKLEAKLRELNPEQRNSSAGQDLEKKIGKMGKKQGKAAKTSNPMHS